MIRYLLRRAAMAVVIVWVVSSLTLLGTLTCFGDPVAVYAGPHASARDRRHVREFYALDKPLRVQYVRYMSRLLHGDLGESPLYHRPVTAMIAERFPRTVLLAVMAIVIEITIGVALGLAAALRRGTRADSWIMGGSFFAMSVPTFISGKLALLGLAYYLARYIVLFPMGGYGLGFWDHVHHAILPAVVLALTSTAYYARLTRNELLDVLQSDYVRTARAKGLSDTAVAIKHALRNALLPIVTDLGLSFGTLFTGAIVTEAIFQWPGMGRLAYESIATLDFPVIVGTVILGSFGIQLGNLLSDLAYAALDPRIRRV